MTPDIHAEIAKLRSLNLSPKQIARKLGIRPAEVSAILKEQAQSGVSADGRPKGLPPIDQCLINEGAAKHLLKRSSRLGWFGRRNDAPDEDDVGGLAQLFVVRVEREQFLVSSYLIDYWCLGVKNTFGPRKMNRPRYQKLIEQTKRKFVQDFREIRLEEAQAIVFGAVDYASSLGFSPHKDYQRSQQQLGVRPEQLIDIEFGHKGQPFYISGPNDNPHKIIATLNKHVGEGNFQFLSHL